jgi:hypothetical protein
MVGISVKSMLNLCEGRSDISVFVSLAKMLRRLQ